MTKTHNKTQYSTSLPFVWGTPRKWENHNAESKDMGKWG